MRLEGERGAPNEAHERANSNGGTRKRGLREIPKEARQLCAPQTPMDTRKFVRVCGPVATGRGDGPAVVAETGAARSSSTRRARAPHCTRVK